MRLLISVANVDDAREALAGGADIIDAKDPAAGALGPVTQDVLRAIVRTVAGERPVSVALGDAHGEREIEMAARRAALERVAYLKIGFAGVRDVVRVEGLIAAAVRGATMVSGSAGVIAVAYADASLPGVDTVTPELVVSAAERAGAMGVLLDTAVKGGGAGGLFSRLRARDIAAWLDMAHHAALTAAVAGSLAASELTAVRVLGADVAGVRGAACDGGRGGRVTRERVAALAQSAGQLSWPGREIAERREAVDRARRDVTLRATLP